MTVRKINKALFMSEIDVLNNNTDRHIPIFMFIDNSVLLCFINVGHSLPIFCFRYLQIKKAFCQKQQISVFLVKH